MNFSEATVFVTTRHETINRTFACEWFRLSDYGDLGEFYSDCHAFFRNEKNPSFIYLSWENIPDRFINRKWFCPNYFEVRDAMERLDESEKDYFMTWCDFHKHNITLDDPHLLVSHYQDIHASHPEIENDEVEVSEDALLYQNFPNNPSSTERSGFEVFNENYD